MKKKRLKHIAMGWTRQEIEQFSFPSNYEVVNYDGSQKQKEEFYYIWNGKQGTTEEVDNLFVRYFINLQDCEPSKDLFFVKHNGKYIGTVTALYHPQTNSGHIHCFAIIEEYRGKRLSYPLMTIAMNKVYNDGAEQAYLVTDDWRVPAMKVYLHYNFLPRMNEFWPHKKRKMFARWKKIYDDFGVSNLKMYNKNYKLMRIPRKYR